MPRRGETTQAAYAHAAGPEQDAQATQCGMARGEITSSRATPPHGAADDGRKEDVGRERPAGLRRFPAENQVNNLKHKARVVCIFGRRGAAQQRGPHLCKQPDRNETCAQIGVALRAARSQHSAQQRPVKSHKTDAKQTWGRERPAGQRGLAGGDLWITFCVCASGTQRGHPRRGATPRAACLQAAGPARDAQTTHCSMAHGAITKPRATSLVAPWATYAKKTWGGSYRPGSEALPAENRENG